MSQAGSKRKEISDEEKDTSGEPKEKRNHTWITRNDERSEEPHPGSFASKAMQELFDVTVRDVEEDPEVKRSKRKVALFIAYLGTRYGGLQINEGQRSVQAEIELALYLSQLIKKSNFGFPHKNGWAVSGRTDKGVHACAQVVSLKIEIADNQSLDEVREIINDHLPTDIRVLDVVRVTKKFCAHTQRDRVRYQYLIPAFLFYDTAHLKDIFEKLDPHKKNPQSKETLSFDEREAIRNRVKDYRITPQQLQILKSSLKQYEGSHFYHNFTRGVKAGEDRARRFIESFTVGEPMEFEDGTQWVPTQVHGQSFMIHQIRKMISMAVDVARGVVPTEYLANSLERSAPNIYITKAPAQGLFLEMSFYNAYNDRKNRTQNSQEDTPDIDWDTVDSKAHERWKRFRDETIMAHIVEEEKREMNFALYLFYMEEVFDRRQFYNLSD